MERSEPRSGNGARVERTQSTLWVGAISILLAAGLAWWMTPMQGKFKALAVPLTRPLQLGVSSNAGVHPNSIGALFVGIAGLTVLLTLFRAPRRILFYLGAVVVAVCLAFALNMVFRDATVLDALLDQRDQEKTINSFSRSYLEGVSSFLEPDKTLTTDTLLDRVTTTRGFMGFGFWSAMIGGALLMIGTLAKRGGRTLAWDALALLLVGGALIGFYTAKGISGEHYRQNADRALARGLHGEALDGYAAAVARAPILKTNASFTYNVGTATYALGLVNRPEYHLYLADNFLSTKDYSNADAEYEKAAGLGADPVLIVRKKVASRMRDGLSHYSHGRDAEAISNWYGALDADPGQIQAHFFLIKGYLDILGRDQAKSLGEGAIVLDITQEKLIRGDTYNLLGDAYYKQRDYQKAREMYATSNKQFNMVKKIINFESMRGLQGI